MIERAAGRTDDDACVGQGTPLWHERTTAIQQRVRQPQWRRQGGEHGADLDGQLACWHQDQGLDPASVRIETLEQRQDERKRFARTGSGLTDDILAGQENGDSFRLDWRWLTDRLRMENAAKSGLQGKIGERRRTCTA